MIRAGGTTIEEIEQELSTGTAINEKANLGCRVKFPIEYVLAGLKQLKANYRNLRIAPREDVYIFDTNGSIALHRFDRSLNHMQNGGTSELTDLLTGIDPIGVVTLLALDGRPDQFVERVRQFYDPLENSGRSLTLGKGHTIRTTNGESEFGVLDFIASQPGNFYGVANNDTIVDIDCKLPHSSWITVFTAINNALNDLFASGVYQNIRIFPTIAGTSADETQSLQEAIAKYADKFSQYGFQIEAADPLGLSAGGYSTKVVGATVIGTTDKEVPRNEYLREGQILFATRPVGDLIPLAEYMALAYEIEAYTKAGATVDTEKTDRLKELESLRVKILQHLVTPNFETAKIISKYLPKKGDSFDDSQHITSSIDVSGPGIQTVAWLAQDSGKDVYLDNIVYHDDSIPTSSVHADQTAGTNGAIILAAQPDVATRVMADLQATGYEPWHVGRVGQSSSNPVIYIEPQAIAKLPAFANRDLNAYFRNHKVTNDSQ